MRWITWMESILQVMKENASRHCKEKTQKEVKTKTQKEPWKRYARRPELAQQLISDPVRPHINAED